MVYFKVLLNDKRTKSDSIYPVVVRVTYNRNNTTFSTGIRVKSNLWDAASLSVKPSHPNAQAYNKTISDFYGRIQNLAYQLINESSFSFEDLKQRLQSDSPIQITNKAITFKTFAESLVTDLMAINKTGNAIVYSTAINRFTAFVANSRLRFMDIDYNLLEGFKRHLIKEGMKQNTVSNYFRTLRAIYNKAIKAKIVDRSRYPFLDITNMTTEIGNDKLALSDVLENWFSKNAQNGSYHIQGTTKLKMIFDDVKIPVRDQNGNIYTSNRFALELYRFLKSQGLNPAKQIKGNAIYITLN